MTPVLLVLLRSVSDRILISPVPSIAPELFTEPPCLNLTPTAALEMVPELFIVPSKMLIPAALSVLVDVTDAPDWTVMVSPVSLPVPQPLGGLASVVVPLQLTAVLLTGAAAEVTWSHDAPARSTATN